MANSSLQQLPKLDARQYAALVVPTGKASCHTAQVGGYFVEGHVPAEDIKRLLTDKPEAFARH